VADDVEDGIVGLDGSARASLGSEECGIFSSLILARMSFGLIDGRGLALDVKLSARSVTFLNGQLVTLDRCNLLTRLRL